MYGEAINVACESFMIVNLHIFHILLLFSVFFNFLFRDEKQDHPGPGTPKSYRASSTSLSSDVSAAPEASRVSVIVGSGAVEVSRPLRSKKMGNPKDPLMSQ